MQPLQSAILFFILFGSCFSCQEEKPTTPYTEEDVAKIHDQLNGENDELTPENLFFIDSVIQAIVHSGYQDSTDLLADAHRVLGLGFYGFDLLEEAIHTYSRGLQVQASDQMKARIYTNQGFAYHYQQQYAEAITAFEQARKHQIKDKNHPAYFISTAYIGDCLVRTGHYQTAKEYLLEALHIQAAFPADSYHILDETYLFLADAERYLRNFQGSVRAAEKGIALFSTEQGMNEILPESVKLFLNLANAWQDSMYALPNSNVGRKQAGDKAEMIYRAILTFQEETTSPEEQLKTRLNLGEVLRRKGQLGEANQVLRQGLNQLPPEAQNSLLAAQLKLNLGEVLLDQKEFSEAEEQLQSALSDLLLVPERSTETKIPNISKLRLDNKSLAALLGIFGRYYATTGNINRSLAAYDSLIVLGNQWRLEFISDADRFLLTQQIIPQLNQAFALCIQQYEESKDPDFLKKAFYYSEQQKANNLLAQIRQKTLFEQIPTKDLQAFKGLLKTENTLRRKWQKATTNPEEQQQIRQEWTSNLAAKRQYLQKIYRNQRELAHPNLYQTKPLDRLLPTLELADNQSILEYHLLDQELHTFLIQEGNIQHFRQPVAPVFFEYLKDIDALLAANELNQTVDLKSQAFCRASSYLYQQLIAPVSEFLPRRLIIIPDPSFLNLPFEALWTQKYQEKELPWQGKSAFFLQEHAISYCYSANLLEEMQQAKNKKRKKLAAFASSFPKSYSQNSLRKVAPQIGQNLAYLIPINNEQELESIGQVLSAKTYRGVHSEKKQFLAACQKYQAIHIASHGILIPSAPELNFISFTQQEEFDPDQLLYLQELYNLQLNLELVSFSACQTARGRFIEGEGNLSLARGLASAGVKSIVTTLWNLNRSEAAQLFPSFYLALHHHKPKDIALQEAKIEFMQARRSHIDPSLWAGIVLIGNTAALSL